MSFHSGFSLGGRGRRSFTWTLEEPPLVLTKEDAGAAGGGLLTLAIDTDGLCGLPSSGEGPASPCFTS